MGGQSSSKVEDSPTPDEAATIEGMLHKCIIDLHDFNSPIQVGTSQKVQWGDYARNQYSPQASERWDSIRREAQQRVARETARFQREIERRLAQLGVDV